MLCSPLRTATAPTSYVKHEKKQRFSATITNNDSRTANTAFYPDHQ